VEHPHSDHHAVATATATPLPTPVSGVGQPGLRKRHQRPPGPPPPGHLQQHCRAASQRQLGRLARRLRPTHTDTLAQVVTIPRHHEGPLEASGSTSTRRNHHHHRLRHPHPANPQLQPEGPGHPPTWSNLTPNPATLCKASNVTAYTGRPSPSSTPPPKLSQQTSFVIAMPHHDALTLLASSTGRVAGAPLLESSTASPDRHDRQTIATPGCASLATPRSVKAEPC